MAAAPNNINVASASTHTTVTHADNSSELEIISSFNSENGSSAMTNSRDKKLPPSALVRTTSFIDKENNHNSSKMMPHHKDSKPSAAVAGLNYFHGTGAGAFSQRPESKMMDFDYRESEKTMMADDLMASNNGSSQQKNNISVVGEIRLPDNCKSHEMNNLDDLSIDDDDDDIDGSDCSGSTVVADEKPPTGLTEEELTKYYWEICYGPGHVVPPPTVLKCVPTKSW